jgi:hypothetical protein
MPGAIGSVRYPLRRLHCLGFRAPAKWRGVLRLYFVIGGARDATLRGKIHAEEIVRSGRGCVPVGRMRV